MLLALANFVDSNWDTVWLTLGVLLAIEVTVVLLIARRRRSLRLAVWGVVSGIVSCSVLAVAWHFWGWETEHTDTGWSIRRHRAFGRVVQLAYDLDGDWFADAKVRYSYSNPWVPSREYKHDYLVAMEDRNRDGRWDTWWRPTSEVINGKRVLLLQADMDLDGSPDYEIRELAELYSEGLKEIERRRGF